MYQLQQYLQNLLFLFGNSDSLSPLLDFHLESHFTFLLLHLELFLLELDPPLFQTELHLSQFYLFFMSLLQNL